MYNSEQTAKTGETPKGTIIEDETVFLKIVNPDHPYFRQRRPIDDVDVPRQRTFRKTFIKPVLPTLPSWQHIKFVNKAGKVFLSLILAMGLSRVAAAQVLRMVGPDIISQLNMMNSVEIMDTKNQSYPLRPRGMETLSLPLMDTESDAFALYRDMLGQKEDGGALRRITPFRVMGTDAFAIARAIPTHFFGGDGRGASTIPHQICSRVTDSYTLKINRSGLMSRASEAWCAASLVSQTHSRPDEIFAHAATHLPVAVGAQNSYFGRGIHGVKLGAPLLFGQDFEELKACQIALLVASHQHNLRLPQGDSGLNEAQSSWFRNVKTAKRDLVRFSEKTGRIQSADVACFNKLVPPWERDNVEHPENALLLALGPMTTTLLRETAALAGSVHELGFSVKDAQKSRGAITEVLCSIQSRRNLKKTICPRETLTARIAVDVIAEDGTILIAQHFGPAGSRAFAEPRDGTVLGRGSTVKGLLLLLLRDMSLCRQSSGSIQDPDGFMGVSAQGCKAGQGHVSLVRVASKSMNLPTLYGLEQLSDAEFTAVTTALGLPNTITRAELVLGVRGLPLQSLLAAFGALSNSISGAPALGYEPHFVNGSSVPHIDLSEIASDGKFIETLLSEALRSGTARQFSHVTRSAGLQILTAKTGTSESGTGTQERGRHIVGTMVGPNGKTLTYFVEIASPDSSALSNSGVISSGELGALLVAAFTSIKTEI